MTNTESDVVLEILTKTVKDMNSGIYDFTDNGECIGCGECCSNLLPMTRNEIDRIKRYIKKNKIKKQIHMIAPLAQWGDLYCPFLDMKKRRINARFTPFVRRCAAILFAVQGKGRTQKLTRKLLW